MKTSRSEFLDVRGLRYHIRIWGNDDAPRIYLLHGWLDCSASFQYVIDALKNNWQVIAPDWRGFGQTQWCETGYWWPDYPADLEVILKHYSPEGPITLIGHSLGAQVASIYAGLRTNRVSKLVCLDGLNIPDSDPAHTPKRLRGWLDQIADPPVQKSHDSFDALSKHIRKYHSQIEEEMANFLARCWGYEHEDGRIWLYADPKHRIMGPSAYHLAESMAVWQEVIADTLIIDGGASALRMRVGEAGMAERHACFQSSRTEVVEGAGHMLHFDKPAQTAALIEDFLTAG